jgi:hypothetical protein
VVPGAADGVGGDEPFCERATVVGAVGANGKELVTTASQNYFFAIGLARYHASIAEIANGKSILKIECFRLLYVCHDLPPEPVG